MSLPYKVATLLYAFNERDEILLLERTQEPNRGCWSPCGGKLHMEMGESPYACACREAEEEIGIEIQAADLHLFGVISEHGYQDQAHWLIFLFEIKLRLTKLPPIHREGKFGFFRAEQLASLKMPQSDLEQIWPLFWKHRGGFFAAHCHCTTDQPNQWIVEESQPLLQPDL